MLPYMPTPPMTWVPTIMISRMQNMSRSKKTMTLHLESHENTRQPPQMVRCLGKTCDTIRLLMQELHLTKVSHA